MGYTQDNTTRHISLQQIRQESMSESHKTGQINLNLLVELLEVETTRVREVVDTLETRIQEETVDLCLRNDRLYELGDLVDIGQVKWEGLHLVWAILLHELLQTVLATANDGDFDARVQQAFSQSFSNPGCCANKENVFVREGHFVLSCTAYSVV